MNAKKGQHHDPQTVLCVMLLRCAGVGVEYPFGDERAVLHSAEVRLSMVTPFRTGAARAKYTNAVCHNDGGTAPEESAV